MSKYTGPKRTRAEIRADLDESYDTDFYRYRVGRRFPFRMFNILFNIIVPTLIGLLFQQTFGWIIGFIILYFVIDCIIFAVVTAKWNYQIKKYGLESFRAQFDPTYEKDGK